MYAVDSWIVYNFVGCGLAAKSMLVMSLIIVFQNGFQKLVKSQSYVKISQVHTVQSALLLQQNHIH